MKVLFNSYITNNFYKSNYNKVQKYHNLAPLQQDTVSFSGSNKKQTEKTQNVFTDPANKGACNTVRKNAEPSRIYLQALLEHYLAPIQKEYGSDKKPFTFITRLKSSKSIKQKIIYKLPDKLIKEGEEFAKYAVEELKNFFNFNKDVTDEQLYNLIINNSDYRNTIENSCAFKSPDAMLKIIKNALVKAKVINFNEIDEKELKKDFKKIASNLRNKAPEMSDQNYVILGSADPCSRIKNFIHDIVRGRIVLNDKDPVIIDKILEAFKKMVKDGNIKITSIEYIMPESSKMPKGTDVNDYMPIKFTKLLRDAIEVNVEKVNQRPSKSGYCAIHINVELSNKLLSIDKDKYNGYSAEIQIMDSHVEELKEIEDLLYKFNDNIPLSNKEYAPMAELFKSKLTPDVEKAFVDYRYQLYLRQMTNPLKGKKNLFPSLKEMGFEGKIPPELDFNNLKKFKDKCDEAIKLREKNENLKEKYKAKNSEYYAIETLGDVVNNAISGGLKNLSLNINN